MYQLHIIEYLTKFGDDPGTIFPEIQDFLNELAELVAKYELVLVGGETKLEKVEAKESLRFKQDE